MLLEKEKKIETGTLGGQNCQINNIFYFKWTACDSLGKFPEAQEISEKYLAPPPCNSHEKLVLSANVP